MYGFFVSCEVWDDLLNEIFNYLDEVILFMLDDLDG